MLKLIEVEQRRIALQDNDNVSDTDGESVGALVVVHSASIGGEFFSGGPIPMNERTE
ncbi:hypothetical protein LguiB_027635 [Lonicera macranthoides]